MSLVMIKPLMAGNFSFEEMKMEYGINKIFTNEVEVPAVIALSFFPELKHTQIRFEYKLIKTTMAARPEIQSVFNAKRSYVIYINDAAEKIGSVSFDVLSLKQKIGIIAHELAHILDYERRNNLSLLICGFQYKCFPSYHKNLERNTDEMVISKGLGNELFEFANHVIYHSNASEKYIDFKKKNYLLPDEIKSRLTSQK